MMQQETRQMSAEMQRCIQACMDCHRVCVETASYCLQMGGAHAEAKHIRGLMDCAQICATSADFMLRMSPLHPQTCNVCAMACQECAKSCDRFQDDDMMKRCAQECRSCAQSCNQMARM